MLERLFIKSLSNRAKNFVRTMASQGISAQEIEALCQTPNPSTKVIKSNQ